MGIGWFLLPCCWKWVSVVNDVIGSTINEQYSSLITQSPFVQFDDFLVKLEMEIIWINKWNCRNKHGPGRALPCLLLPMPLLCLHDALVLAFGWTNFIGISNPTFLVPILTLLLVLTLDFRVTFISISIIALSPTPPTANTHDPHSFSVPFEKIHDQWPPAPAPEQQ
jgi:hypothetical protein